MTRPIDSEVPHTRNMRLGVLYPASGAEDEYQRMAQPLDGIDLQIAHTESDNSHDVIALRQTAAIGRLIAGASSLIPWKPDVVTWACTSGSFIVGRKGALAQIEALRETLGVPTGSTSLAFVEAVVTLNVERVAVLAPYGRAASELFAEFLSAWNIEVVAMERLDLESGFDSAGLTPADVEVAASRADHPRAQALLIPDTALHSLDVITPLRSKLGKPVLAANPVTMWQALRLIGRETGDPGGGT